MCITTYKSGRASPNLQYATSSPLNVNMSIWFWMSWLGGCIQAGSGTIIGQNLIIQYHDSNPLTIRGVGVAVFYYSVIYSTYTSTSSANIYYAIQPVKIHLLLKIYLLIVIAN